LVSPAILDNGSTTRLSLPSARVAWVDIARGLGIMAVVIGHTEAPGVGYLYFFHMPLFFILSGFLAKPAGDWAGYRAKVAKSAQRLLLPYLSFLLIITLIRYGVLHETHPAWYRHDLRTLFFGGAALVGCYGPFWFITCLFVTQLLFELLHVLVKPRNAILAVVVAAYLLAHLETAIPWFTGRVCPWSMDTALLALAYYSFGYYAKPLLNREWMPKVSVPLTLAVALIALMLSLAGMLHFWLDMKTRIYHDIILDLLIPLTLSTAVCYLAAWLSRRQWSAFIANLGVASLTVMYLHMSVNTWVMGIPALCGPLRSSSSACSFPGCSSIHSSNVSRCCGCCCWVSAIPPPDSLTGTKMAVKLSIKGIANFKL